MALGEVFESLAARRMAFVDARDAPLVAELAAYGVTVRGDHAILDERLELLDANAIRAQLGATASAWLKTLEVFPHIGSTNTELMQRAAGGEIDGTVLLAEAQTAGRGRRGRQWASPFARNLALSLGIRIRRPLEEIGAVSLAVGVAVAQTLTAAGVRGITVKWPNDVLAHERKLCGILIELPGAAAPPHVVVGIGVNMGSAAALAQRVEQPIADVLEHVPQASRNAVAGALIDAVVTMCRRFEADGFAAIKPAYEALHGFHGRPARIVSGAETFVGTVVGVDLDGALRLRGEAGERAFSAGEVSLRA